jgi:FkbM family methyltransferase
MIISKFIRKIFSANFINKSKHAFGLEIDSEFELERISRMDRFQKGKTNLIHPNFEFIDSESFVNQYVEIFNHKILHFNSDEHRPYIIDCGSNIGVSILYFNQIFPQAKIIGFEPDPRIFNTLEINTSNLKNTDIKVLNSAIWHEKSSLNFSSDGSDGGTICDNGDIKVNAIDLIPYLKQKVDFLKIDIEGAEHEVLPSIANYLKNVRNLFLELHVNRDSPIQIEETFKLLREQGFRYKFNSVGKVKFDSFAERTTFDQQINIFAINENS